MFPKNLIDNAKLVDSTRSSESISKQTLIDTLGISAPTLNDYTKIFIQQNIFLSNVKSGSVALNRNYCCFWGISIGGSNIKISVIDFSFTPILFPQLHGFLQEHGIFSDKRFDWKNVESTNAICAATPSELNELIDILDLILENLIEFNKFALQNAEHLKIAGIGFAFSGAVNHRSQTVIQSPNIPYLKETNINTLISANRLAYFAQNNIILTFENNANAAVIAEKNILNQRNDVNPPLKKAKNIACLYLGTGLGLGLILDGKLYKGVQHCGEIGHIPIVLNEKYLLQMSELTSVCSCGSNLCLEQYMRKYVFGDSGLHSTQNQDIIATRKRLLSMDPHDIPYADSLANAIGYAINIISLLLNVELVILTGRLTEYLDDPEISLWSRINKERLSNQLSYIRNSYSIIESKYGVASAAVGVAIESYFDAIGCTPNW